MILALISSAVRWLSVIVMRYSTNLERGEFLRGLILFCWTVGGWNAASEQTVYRMLAFPSPQNKKEHSRFCGGGGGWVCVGLGGIVWRVGRVGAC